VLDQLEQMAVRITHLGHDHVQLRQVHRRLLDNAVPSGQGSTDPVDVIDGQHHLREGVAVLVGADVTVPLEQEH
jgi:hypothetical protein